jgi:hypothetical protein
MLQELREYRWGKPTSFIVKNEWYKNYVNSDSDECEMRNMVNVLKRECVNELPRVTSL